MSKRLFIVFIADRHLGFLVPHMHIQLVPGGQNALLAMHFVHESPAECGAKKPRLL
jgi:hypothetical protein